LVTLDDRLEAFAHATRLTTTEASRLVLSTHADRYPPISESLKVAPGKKPSRTPIDAWVFSTFTRYCPACLAGDDSVIQRRHGGPWKAEWRLPVIFTCPIHRTFLRHTCSSCTRSAHVFDNVGCKLLPLMRISGLHPAQCRNPKKEPTPNRLTLCGARLDTALPPNQLVPPALLRLQDQIRAQLEETSDASAARRYFTALRALSALLAASWPQGREFTTRTTTENMTHYIEDRRKQTAARLDHRGQRASFLNWDHPPPSAAATAALLHAADQVLALGRTDFRNMLRGLAALVPEKNSGQWGHVWRHVERHGSAGICFEISRAFKQRRSSRG
jgi:hypothetical protein